VEVDGFTVSGLLHANYYITCVEVDTTIQDEFIHHDIINISILFWDPRLSTEGLASKVGQDEAGTVNVLVVVAAQTLLLLAGPGANGLAHVAAGVLAADHEADLAGGVGGDGGVGVLGNGEDLTAGLLEVSDQREVEPLVLGC